MSTCKVCLPGRTCSPCGSTKGINKKTCKALTLQCIDFRLRDNITCNLNFLGYLNQHDDVILAGSSLGYNGQPDTFEYPAWVQTIDDHVKIAYDLHKISEIILIDHMQCGAYGVAYPGLTLGGEEEYNLHVENLNAAAEKLKEKYEGPNASKFEIPNLIIRKWVIGVYGACIVDIDVYKGPFPFPPNPNL